MADAPKPLRRLTDTEVQQILRMHVRDEMPATVIAERFGVKPNAIYEVIWGRTHAQITRGRNVSTVRRRRDRLRAEVARVFAETGNKSETARLTGVSRPTVHYYLKQEDGQ